MERNENCACGRDERRIWKWKRIGGKNKSGGGRIKGHSSGAIFMAFMKELNSYAQREQKRHPRPQKIR